MVSNIQRWTPFFLFEEAHEHPEFKGGSMCVYIYKYIYTYINYANGKQNLMGSNIYIIFFPNQGVILKKKKKKVFMWTPWPIIYFKIYI